MKQNLYKIYGFLHSLKYPSLLKEFDLSYEVVWLENHWDDVAKLNIDELEKLFQKYIKFEDITKKYSIKSSNDCKENIVV